MALVVRRIQPREAVSRMQRAIQAVQLQIRPILADTKSRGQRKNSPIMPSTPDHENPQSTDDPGYDLQAGPHVRTRPQKIRVPVTCIPFNLISGRHSPARLSLKLQLPMITRRARDMQKDAVQCGVDVTRDYKSHAGRKNILYSLYMRIRCLC